MSHACAGVACAAASLTLHTRAMRLNITSLLSHTENSCRVIAPPHGQILPKQAPGATAPSLIIFIERFEKRPLVADILLGKGRFLERSSAIGAGPCLACAATRDIEPDDSVQGVKLTVVHVGRECRGRGDPGF